LIAGPLRPCLLLFLLALACSARAAPESVAEAEIQYLLAFVAGSHCDFIRNGTSHDSAEAADHLRLKYSRGRKYAGSAEQFIDRLASESSWTGKPYTVNCGGRTEPARDWLRRALADYRSTAAATPGDDRARQ
jgi:hypothetical protein